MSKQWFIRLTVATAALVAQIAGSDSVVVRAHQTYNSPFFQNYGTSWIADPEGHHYQFHISKQSWNMAREYCLALASDLVVISSLQQMNWLISHYPISNSIMPERTLQIGLVLVDKENTTGKEWKWVDNTPLNAPYLEWEILTINATEEILYPTEHGLCALLSIDNRILKTIPCDQTPDSDHTNRYICQRSHEQHYEHEKKNNPFYELFVQLISKLQMGATAKSELRTEIEPQEIVDVQKKTEHLSSLNGMNENFTDKNKEDSLTKIKEIFAKSYLTTINPNAEGIDEAHFGIEQNEQEGQRGEEKDSKHELRSKNFAVKLKSIMHKGNTENNEDVFLADEIGSGLKRNVTILRNLTNPPQQKSQQSDILCNENDTAQKHMRQWYEQFGDIFRNLNLFLKQEKSSDLRVLLDSNDTNKTLVERLKEALRSKNNTEMSKPHLTKKKKTSRNEINNQPQFDDSTQEAHEVSNSFAHEIIDDISGVLLHKKKTAGKAALTAQTYDMRKLGKTKIHGKDASAQRSEDNEDGIYELLGKKLRTVLNEHLRNLSNLARNKSREEIKLKSNAIDQMNQNEVHYNGRNDQKPGSSSLLSVNQKNNITEDVTSVLHNSQQTTKRSTKSSNETGASLQLSNNVILLEEGKENDGNKTNIKIDIQRAITNMKQNLENASEEIKRLFSHSRDRDNDFPF
ncbi:unnamed protein product [Litomosoides sigmodontis]|uniref:C-type lectin domain-containing protein n=1 Tax=Litomosoides sigmodontis TaxID=42156 RepID=A0A3P6TE57_LITSI|nr:unnamed protein product [Litomosoides sigmodontis]